MIVSCHQPNFIPWLTFFEKMRRSDVMVLLDKVQYAKNSMINKNSIINGIFLTIPVHFSSGMLINEVTVNNPEKWKKKHIFSLKNYPKKNANYEIINSFIEEVYNKIKSDKLADYNIASIRFIKKHLNIKTKIVLQSELKIPAELKGTDRLVAIVKKVKGNEYLSGKGAVEKTKDGPAYLETEKFRDIKLSVLDYTPKHDLSALHHIIMGYDF
ncbi:MAG: hypothetical protein CMI58_01090 [Parcubacteria group bacterium]|nr:hypothetical protein [Parcubacteria group bacterium]MDP7244893.1 WbqC family protein [Flavobacteriales bacterium]